MYAQFSFISKSPERDVRNKTVYKIDWAKIWRAWSGTAKNFWKNNGNYNNNENSLLLLEILKNRISNLERGLIEKDAFINFLLKQKSETNDTSSAKQTVTENYEMLDWKEETLVVALIGNKKEKLKQNISVRKRKLYWPETSW